MTKDEALHKALKVLNCLNNDRVYETEWVKGAINACEEALTRAQQVIRANNEALEQPTMTYEDGFAHGYEAHRAEQALEQPAQEPTWIVNNTAGTKLRQYTHPAPPWQGLSDDELDDISICEQISPDRLWHIYVAIGQALKEKNNA